MNKNDLRARLLNAIEDGEVLLVRYNGGTQPGTIRELEPMEFIGAEKIWASCYSSGKEKQFFLSKMEIIESTDLGLITYKSDDDDDEEYEAMDSDTSHETVFLVDKPSIGKRLWRYLKHFLVGYLILTIIIIIYAVFFH